MRNTDQDWTQIAEDQPYWGILSTEEFKGAELSVEKREKFFGEGEQFISDLFAEIKRDYPAFSPKRALDFGCGVARLLMPIARRSGEAVGVDIAPKMLELAKANLDAAGLTNSTLALSDDTLSAVTGTFDFVHSYIVIQHIPPERGYEYFQLLLDKLEVGGIFAVQFSFGKRRDLMVHEMPRATYYRREGSSLQDLCVTRTQFPTGTVQMYDYDLNQVFAIASTYTSLPIHSRVVADTHLSIYMIGQRNISK